MYPKQTLTNAITFYKQDNLVEAESLFLKVLNSQKHLPEACYTSGLKVLESGLAKSSLAYFEAALDRTPQNSSYWVAYIDALDQSGQSEIAQTMFETAKLAGLGSKESEFLTERFKSTGNTTPLPSPTIDNNDLISEPDKEEIEKIIDLFQENKSIECEQYASNLIKRFPGNGFLWKIYGATLKQQDRLEEAIVAMRQSVKFSPDDPQALNNLGVALCAYGILDESEEILKRAIYTEDNYAEFHNNLGVTVMAQGRQEEAQIHFTNAIEVQNDYAQAYCNLSVCLKNQGKYEDAESIIRHSIDLDPQNAATYNNLGNFLHGRSRLSEAKTYLQKAIVLDPYLAKAHSNLGNVYQGFGDIEKSINAYKKSLHCNPKFSDAYDGLLFVSNYSPEISNDELYSLYQEYNKRFASPHQLKWKEHKNNLSLNRRLKIGYVSPAFYKHPVVSHLLPLLNNHNRDKFEIYAYADVLREDYKTNLCKKNVNHWISTIGMSDDALADKIRRDKIDILIDLAGHASQNRLAVFAQKPAPVSLHWLDFGYTTGLSAIDYYLTDHFTAPIGSEVFFSEQLWRLSTPPYTYHPADNMGEVGPLPANKNGYITFGTLTRAIRLNDATLNAWITILRRVEKSKIIIDSVNFKDKKAQDNLRKRFVDKGIPGDRILIGFNSPPWDLFRTIDISLDCFPHNSGTTLFESLYMGIPYITYANRPGVGRIGGSILTGIKRYDWIAYSVEEYIEKTVQLASDLPELTSIRTNLRSVVKESSLMNDKAFTNAVEDAFLAMFKKWTNSQENTDKISPAIALDAATLYNKGIELQTSGQPANAQKAYIQAVNIQPGFVEAYNNLGVVFQQTDQFQNAESCFLKALELHPDYTDCCFNLANTYKMQSSLFKAEKYYKKVISMQADYPGAHYNLGNILQEQGRPEKALKILEQAIQLQPEDINTFSTLLYTLNYHPDISSDAIFKRYTQFNQNFCEQLETTWRPHKNKVSSQRCLNIGYVAPGYRKHPARYFLEPLLANHDKKKFKIFAYINISKDATHKDLFFKYADECLPVKELNDEELAATIRQHKIDILVDLSGHTAGNRLQCFAMRPTPVSLHWLDFGYTTGLTAIDYYLTDRTTAPPESQNYFSEKLLTVDTPALAYRPPDNTGDVNTLPALQNKYITFGTLTRAVRLNYKTIRTWSKILKRTPGSKLIINSGSFVEVEMQELFISKFNRYNISRDRLIIGSDSPPWDILRTIDIMLDCFPHNSGTTLIESLYMGVPYITMADRPSMGRLGSAILEGIGHPEWIATNEESYIELAVSLSEDISKLSTIRNTLREDVKNSPLMDEKGFTGKIESAYHGIFKDWCNNQTSSLTMKKNSRKKCSTNRSTKRKNPPKAKLTQLATLFDKGRHKEALQIAKSLTKQFPKHGFAWKVLGPLLFQQGLTDDAIQAMQQAAIHLPNDCDCQYNLGIALEQSKRYQEAIACYRKALELNPKSTQSLFNLGAIYTETELYEDAIAAFRQVIKLTPNDYKALCNLGLLYKNTGKLNESIQCYETALTIQPDIAEAYNNLSLTYTELGRLDDAKKSSKKAIELNPQLPEAYNNLALVYQKLGELIKAESFCQKAIERNPDYSTAYSNLGTTLIKKGELEKAETNLRKAISLKSDDPVPFSNLLFLLNNHPDKTAEEIYSEYELFNSRFSDKAAYDPYSYRNDLNVNRKLRVGYVYTHFSKHSTRHFLEPLLAHHDKNKIELYLYTDIVTEDHLTKKYKNYSDHWIPIKGQSDTMVAQKIQSDEIDILIDIAGHTGQNRLGLFAKKPAPVSLHWLDFGYTTGLSAIDYYLTDEVSVPQGSEHFFSETPWCLETPAIAYRPDKGMGEVSTLPAIQQGYVTFATLTRTLRINHKTIRVWAEILKQVENSHLVIDSGEFQDPKICQEMKDKFIALGISEERLEIGYHTPPWDLLRNVDIGLDCFPHNSGTTLIETLYMGSPYITLASRPSVGRLGSSILAGVGHPEWIANTEKEYLDIAVSLASDLPKLEKLREHLRPEMLQSPLMDEKGFTQRVETAYQQMFEKWAMKADSSPVQSTTEIVADAKQQATLCLSNDRFTEALELYHSILSIEPDNAEVNSSIGQILFGQGNTQESLPYLEKAVNITPDNGSYWIVYIDVLRQNGQTDLACQLLEMAIEAGLEGDEVIALGNKLLQSNETGSATDTHPPKAENVPPKKRNNDKNPPKKELDKLVSLFQERKINEAEILALSLTEQFPNNGQAWKILGAIFQQQGQLDKALSAMKTAAKLLPQDYICLRNIGVILVDSKQYSKAEEYCLKSLKLSPNYADGHNSLGVVYRSQGETQKAIKCFKKALKINQESPGYRINLGLVLNDEKKFQEAEKNFLKVQKLTPDMPENLCGLGITYIGTRQLQQAEELCLQAITLKPGYAEAYNALGTIYHTQGSYEKAELAYQSSLEYRPDYIEAMVNLGNVYRKQGWIIKAEKQFKSTLGHQPDNKKCIHYLANILQEQGRIEEAEVVFRTLLDTYPDTPEYHSNMLFLLNNHPQKSGEEIYNQYELFDQNFALPLQAHWTPHNNSIEKDRPLKVGYVSPQFTRHPVRNFLEPLLENHNKQELEIFAYADLLLADNVTERYKSYVDNWVESNNLTDMELAQRIRDDEIDILVDLAGHTGSNRLMLFALKPAPISLHWLDFGYTTGLKAIDYYLTDNTSVPIGSDALFSETPWRIAEPCFAYRPTKGMGEINELPALTNQFITFGSLSRVVRINDNVINVWAELLHNVVNSHLIINSVSFKDPGMQQRYEQKFIDLGIERKRLHFDYTSPPWDVMRNIDIGLDCFPHNSGTTLIESLYMGIPYITLAGRPSVGLLGSAILKSIHHPEWIARNEKEYIDIGVQLASNLDNLSTIRKGLRQEIQTSPLMDETGFTQNVEVAYREMFNKWCEEQI